MGGGVGGCPKLEVIVVTHSQLSLQNNSLADNNSSRRRRRRNNSNNSNNKISPYFVVGFIYLLVF